VLVPPGKEALVESIIGKDMKTSTAWQNAANVAQSQLAQDTKSTTSAMRSEFNISVADYYLGDYAGSVAAYEKVASELPMHTLWYQMEPIESYYQLGNYDEVFTLADSILNNGDPVYPELYVLEGQAYQMEGQIANAKAAFEKALYYNKNLVSAQQALQKLDNY
jgi:tetratricopeptide (TPR) repeat protein